MRFLVDAQLPPGLCDWLQRRGFAAQHVAAALGGQTADAAIAAFAEANSLVLISKDDDFVHRHPPVRYQLVWLRCGNITNRALSAWMEQRWQGLLDALEAGEALVELR